MRSLEITGKTVDDAIRQALQQLGVDREQVDVEVLHQGTPGIFGVGGEPARVRVTVKDMPTAFIKEFLTAIIQSGGWNVVTEEPILKEDEVYVNIDGDDAGLLIGRKGGTLNALQLIVQLAAKKRLQQPVKIVLDVSKYRERRRSTIINSALQAAEKARTGKRPVRLRGLTPSERRIVHITLQSDPTVFTTSEGEGDNRTVVITPSEMKTKTTKKMKQQQSPSKPKINQQRQKPEGTNLQAIQ